MTTAGNSWGNVTVQARVKLLSGTDDIERVVFRYVDANNWGSVYFSKYWGAVGIDQRVNGTRTYSQVAFAPSVGVWYTLKAVVSGSQAQVYVDGVLKTTWTLPNGTTTGKIGLSNDRSHTHFDDVQVLSATADSTLPVISAVAAGSINSIGATITWTTNEASDSQADYGTTTSYGSTMSSASLTTVTSHSVVLSGLAASTLYHYRVKSKDIAGNLTTSADYTFTTAAASATAFSDNFNSGTATGWTVLSGTWAVETGEYSQSATTLYSTMATAGSNWGNVTIQARVNLLSGTDDIERIVFRYVDANNWASVYFSKYYNAIGIDQRVNGTRTFSQVALTPSLGVWYTLKAVVSGGQAQVYLDGTLKHTWTLPSGTTTGKIGLSSDRSHTHFDNVLVTTP
jgi:hypothetical protein